MAQPKIFVSYSREDEKIALEIEGYLDDMGSEVILDQKTLRPGQGWWDHLLDEIEACDVFIPLLSSAWRDSRACRSELDFAVAADRHIVPIVARNDFHSAGMPRAVSDKHYLNFAESRASAQNSIRYGAALLGIVQSAPIGRPAPPNIDRPDVPSSYLNPYRQQLGATTVAHDVQMRMTRELGELLNSREDGVEARALLEMLRNRPDVTKGAQDEIDRLFERNPEPIPEPTGPARRRPSTTAAPADSSGGNSSRKKIGIIAAGIVATILGLGIIGAMIDDGTSTGTDTGGQTNTTLVPERRSATPSTAAEGGTDAIGFGPCSSAFSDAVGQNLWLWAEFQTASISGEVCVDGNLVPLTRLTFLGESEIFSTFESPPCYFTGDWSDGASIASFAAGNGSVQVVLDGVLLADEFILTSRC